MNTARTDKLLRGGSVLRVTEYEVRGINANGDALDVEHHETEAQALEAASRVLRGEAVAWVIERHISYRPAHMAPRDKEPDAYTQIATGGDRAALIAGGWVGE